jgi:hypothetical protein
MRIGLEGAPSSVGSLAPVWSGSGDRAHSVEEADMVSRPWISGLFRESADLVGCLDDDVINGQGVVVEAGADESFRAMVLSD